MTQSKVVFHPSLEGAQHGGRDLSQFFTFCKEAGCLGAQPSNYHVFADGAELTADEVRDRAVTGDIQIDGISCHCPIWVHGTAWTGSKTIRPFIPERLHSASVTAIEEWAMGVIRATLEMAKELNLPAVPMFWGMELGWEVGSGYPWGMWRGPGYDLVSEGIERFVEHTRPIRELANDLGIKLAHEIHPGTAAMCADDFAKLVEACDDDECLAVNADPSHCWEGESFEDRFRHPAVADRVWGVHAKDHFVRSGAPLRSMAPNWPDRAMQFTCLGSGQLDLDRFVQVMLDIGYAERWREATGRDTAPLPCEAESAHYDLDHASRTGVAFIRDNLCLPIAEGSFEDGIGAE